MNRNTTATILIVLAIGIYFTVTKNVISGVKSVQEVTSEYSSAITNADKLISVRDKVNSDWTKISQADQDSLDKMLPSTVDNIRLIIDLSNIGLSDGLTLNSIKATVGSDNQSNSGSAASPSSGTSLQMDTSGGSGISIPVLDTVKVSFGVKASYQQFINFLRDLEANLRLMDVTHLSVVSNDSGTYDFNVDLQTYWLRQQ